MNNYPISRHDPGELPEPPEHFTIAAAAWYWKLAAYCKVRSGIQATTDEVKDVALLMERYEATENERDKEIALMSASIILATMEFCEVDLDHLDIPVHKLFHDQREVVRQRLERWKAKPEHLTD